MANSETPGYRAIGYDFEKQLQAVSGASDTLTMKTSSPRHFRQDLARADGSIIPDVYVRPTESISEDGNTVDVDQEMAKLAENEILYRTAVETINRKIGMIRYAINGGR
ncbi:MAG: flagellar basal body rod protein FlgB [Bdellovibrionota bacterium]